MAHQSNSLPEEGAIVPRDEESILTRRDDSVLPAKPSKLVLRMDRKVRQFCDHYIYDHRLLRPQDHRHCEDEKFENKKLEEFRSPEDQDGVLYAFFESLRKSDCASEDRHTRQFLEKKFTSLVQQILFHLENEEFPCEYDDDCFWEHGEDWFKRAYGVVLKLTEDRMAQPDRLGCKPVPTEAFDTIVEDITDWYFPGIDYKEHFEQLNALLLKLWNRAYNVPEKELEENVSKRVITSLRPLEVALEVFFSCSDFGLPPEVWNVINWWLLPPDTKDLFKPAEPMQWKNCLNQLTSLEKDLRISKHVLDMEKANIVQPWLLEEEKREKIRPLVERDEQAYTCLVQLHQVPQQLQQLSDLLEKNEWASNHLIPLRQVQEQLPQLWKLLPQPTIWGTESVEHTSARAEDQV